MTAAIPGTSNVSSTLLPIKFPKAKPPRLCMSATNETDSSGKLLPIEPAGLKQMGAFVARMHGLGLKVVPMIGAADRLHVQPAMWSLLMGPSNATQQAAFIGMCVDHAKRFGYDGYQTDWEPLSLPEGGLNGTATVVAMQAPYLNFLVRLEAALKGAGVGHSVSAAGYAEQDSPTFRCYTKAELFRGTPIVLYDMGTYCCDDAFFKDYLQEGVQSAGPDNLGVGLGVCGEKCRKTPAQIRQYLEQISAANASRIAMFDAGPTVGTGRDSRLLADGWLPLLSEWAQSPPS